MDSVGRPEVFLLSLAFRSFFDESYASLINMLNASAQVKRAKAAGAALRYLEANNPRAILVTDEGLTERKNRAVLDKVVSYIRDGGLVIVGLHFCNFTDMDTFGKFFNEAFSLPWEAGDYHRTDFEFNPSCSLPTGATVGSLPLPYSMKVLHVKNARSNEKIFIPVTGALTQSQVFPHNMSIRHRLQLLEQK
jgi:hypothetical protein